LYFVIATSKKESTPVFTGVYTFIIYTIPFMATTVAILRRGKFTGLTCSRTFLNDRLTRYHF
jgi:hypothetical protein